MKKIVRLINILDDDVVDKLVYLDRLVRLYAKFMVTWRGAEVTSDGSVVRVKWFRVTKYKYENWTEREFPMEDIDKRIASYKRKIRNEFKKRHENERLLREREQRKWQKVIDDAKIQM